MAAPREWSVWKDFGYPGRVVVPGPKGPIAYTFTPRDFQEMVRTGNSKVRDGWNVPVCWEHQDVTPVKVRMSRSERDREFAKNVLAHIAEFQPTPRGGGKVRIVGTDPNDRAQLDKIRFVSPEIMWDWRDSDGKVWHGPTVTHLAATPRPVQRHQHPFGTNPDAPFPTRSATDLGDVVRMSLVSARGAPGVSPKLFPIGRLRLALDHYAEPPMPDDNLFDKDSDGGSGPGKKPNAWERIATALSDSFGVQMGDVSEIKDPDEFARLVEVAAMNYKAGSEPEGDEYDQPNEDNDEDENATPDGDMEQPPAGATEPPPPVQMSLRKSEEKAVNIERRNLMNEIADLERTRRIGPATAEKLKKNAGTVRLSFAGNGDLKPNAVTTQIDALKELPPNAAWNTGSKPGKGKKGKARLSIPGARTLAPSEYETGAVPNAKDDDAIVAAFESSVGRPAKK